MVWSLWPINREPLTEDFVVKSLKLTIVDIDGMVSTPRVVGVSWSFLQSKVVGCRRWLVSSLLTILLVAHLLQAPQRELVLGFAS